MPKKEKKKNISDSVAPGTPSYFFFSLWTLYSRWEASRVQDAAFLQSLPQLRLEEFAHRHVLGQTLPPSRL